MFNSFEISFMEMIVYEIIFFNRLKRISHYKIRFFDPLELLFQYTVLLFFMVLTDNCVILHSTFIPTLLVHVNHLGITIKIFGKNLPCLKDIDNHINNSFKFFNLHLIVEKLGLVGKVNHSSLIMRTVLVLGSFRNSICSDLVNLCLTFEILDSSDESLERIVPLGNSEQ
ncbi:hypothetical protein BpHYR1_044249 [Brachionus plicatilis]|uniref:Uncharacterized protein n=1 Tax=Brachionus plicatilis TaxID=10195 RepID=A0A3M7QVC7_BRAPC|nr:hypothetical protein BpHYR1_044249 [Brachionus plicatilis]